MPSVEEISASALLPDDSGGADAFDAEELSGSLLIEEPSDGQGPPVVTRLGPAPQEPARAFMPAEPAHRALLGMPQLPKTTPAPLFDHQGRTVQPAPFQAAPLEPEPVHAEDAYSDELAHTDAAPPPGAEAAEAAEEQADFPAEPVSPAPRLSDPVELPKGGLTHALERGREVFGRLREQGAGLLGRLRAALLASASEKPGRRPQWMLPAVTVGGVLVGVGAVGLLFSVGGHRKGAADDEPASTVASSRSAAASAIAPGATGAAPATSALP